MNKRKSQSKSLLTSPERKLLWDLSDDAIVEVVNMRDLYPYAPMPDDIARIPVETVLFQIFKDEDRAKAMDWLQKNLQSID